MMSQKEYKELEQEYAGEVKMATAILNALKTKNPSFTTEEVKYLIEHVGALRLSSKSMLKSAQDRELDFDFLASSTGRP